MPIMLINPLDLDPNTTHEHDIDDELVITNTDDKHAGLVIDRGYSRPAGISHENLQPKHLTPVYALKCDDNIERSAMEKHIEPA